MRVVFDAGIVADDVAVSKIVVMQTLEMLHVGGREERIGSGLERQTILNNELVKKNAYGGGQIHS